MKKLDPMNLTAQLRYRAAGNPPVTLPTTAISNCFPGLEFDFRNVWRRIFVGLEMHEADNYVVAADPEYPQHQELIGHRLLRVDGQPLVTQLWGPQRPGADPIHLTNADNPDGVTFMEWSNVLAEVIHTKAGQTVVCEFTPDKSLHPAGLPEEQSQIKTVQLEVRRFFEQTANGPQAVIARALAEPGELTQGLCAPWQNDYRECACYYWAASRPDYVSVEPGPRGASVGIHWFQKEDRSVPPRQYVLDDREDSRLVSYDDLFREWEKYLQFQLEGRDSQGVQGPEGQRKTVGKVPDERDR